MIAKIYGKSNVYKLKIEIFESLRNFDFLKINHYEHGDVLVQITNIERDNSKLIGFCKILGYRKNNVLKNIKIPFQNDAKIDKADSDFIKEIIGLKDNEEGFFGVLQEHELKVSLDLKKILSKHMAVLAKSGAGKSYSVGVVIEEVMEKNIPIIILDPHNEYSTMQYPNTNKRDNQRLKRFGLDSKGYSTMIKNYSPDIEINPQAEKITLDIKKLTPQELINSLPQKLSPAQSSTIYNIINTLSGNIDVDEIIFSLSNEENNNKWALISQLEMFKKINVYNSIPTPLNEIVKHKQTSIISLKGVAPEVQEVFVSGLLRDLFEARKKEEIPPFFLVLEEAHNFAPERSFGEVKSSKIIRTLAGEGRKFGIGLCVVSQRPAKVDKNVLSQCSTQLLLKITNPNDLKSVISSSEGVDNDSEQEIQRLNIGSGLLTGIVDTPLKINVRPRKSKHGGETVDITLNYEQFSNNKSEKIDKSFQKTNLENSQDSQTFQTTNINLESKEENNLNNQNNQKEKKKTKKRNKEFFQIIDTQIGEEDAKVLLDTDSVQVNLVPALFLKIENNQKEINLLIDKVNSKIVKKIFPFEGCNLPENILKLENSEKKIISQIINLNEKFNPAEILLSSNMMYNEILRICQSLEKKGILKKESESFNSENLKFAKEIENLNFIGNQIFEEVEYDKILDEKINNKEITEIFKMFFNIKSSKDIFVRTFKKI